MMIHAHHPATLHAKTSYFFSYQSSLPQPNYFSLPRWNINFRQDPFFALATEQPRRNRVGCFVKTLWTISSFVRHLRCATSKALHVVKSLELETKNTLIQFCSIPISDFPRVQVGPENPLKVEKDDTATLQCNVDAKPSVKEVRWARNGRFISTNFNYSIPQVTLQSSGSYMCSADNGLGHCGK